MKTLHGAPSRAVIGSAGRDLDRAAARRIVPWTAWWSAPRCRFVRALGCAPWPRT